MLLLYINKVPADNLAPCEPGEALHSCLLNRFVNAMKQAGQAIECDVFYDTSEEQIIDE